MTVKAGDKLPEVTLLRMGENGPEQVALADKLKGRKVVIFGLPAAYSRTCDGMHLPSFIRTKDQFTAKGVDEIICISVNDPFVMGAWGKSSGASEAGIAMLGDAASEFTKAIGMNYSVPAIGFYDRAKRYAMLVEDGVVTYVQTETDERACDLSTGERFLEKI